MPATIGGERLTMATEQEKDLLARGIPAVAAELRETYRNGNRKDVRTYLEGLRPLLAARLAFEMARSSIGGSLDAWANDALFDVKLEVKQEKEKGTNS